MKVLFVWANLDQFGFKPIAISILSAIAKKLGWETKLFTTSEINFGLIDNTQIGEKIKIFKPVDFSPYNINKKKINLEEYFTNSFHDFKPDCLAFSVLSYEHVIAGKIVTIARKLNPKIPIIWGGKYATLNPEKVLREKYADYVCVGEGLDAFSEFLTALKENENTTNIKNIWKKEGKEIIKNELRPICSDLDDLPYLDWDIFDKRHFYKPFDGRVYVGGDHMLNWGCPKSCSYCFNQFYRELYKPHPYRLRRYSVKRIISELKFLKQKFELGLFKFHDEDFLMRPLENLKELAESYKKNINIPFVIMTNGKTVNEEKVKILKEMNCVSVSIGIETGNENLREKVLKRVDTKKDIIFAFKMFKKHNIRTSSFNMLGIPFETRGTYEDTININREADVQYVNTNFFYPFEGTKLREVSIKEGFFFPDDVDNDSIYLQDKPALHFINLSEKELITMRELFIFYVKLPSVYKNFIRRAEVHDVIGKNLKKILSTIYESTVWKNDGWFIDDGKQQHYLEKLRIINENI